MNSRSLRVLEFDKVLSHLAEHTSFSAGRELALTLAPSPDFDEVARRQEETAEAKEWIAHKGDVSLGGARDIRGHIRHAVIGSTLQPPDLLEVADTLRAVAQATQATGDDGFALAVLVNSLRLDFMNNLPTWPSFGDA